MLPSGYSLWSVALCDTEAHAISVYLVPATDSGHALIKARRLHGSASTPVSWARPFTDWVEGQRLGYIDENQLHWDGRSSNGGKGL